MKKKCLMLQTKDNRKFFTYRRNYPQLIEFSKCFGAEISVVKVDEPVILDIVELVGAVCDKNTTRPPTPPVEILEVKISKMARPRSKILSHAKVIKRWIRKKLLSEKPLKLADIAKQYKRYNLTLACFCLHFAAVRKELEQNGCQIEKTGHGEYQLLDRHL